MQLCVPAPALPQLVPYEQPPHAPQLVVMQVLPSVTRAQPVVSVSVVVVEVQVPPVQENEVQLRVLEPDGAQAPA